MSGAAGEVVLIPLEIELQERQTWLIQLRWLAGLGLVVGSFVGIPLLDLPVPFLPLTAVGLGVLGYNLVLYRFGRKVAETLHSLRRTVHLQIALDWAALTATVALTGGIHSPASLGFVFHLIIGSILLSRRACYLLATTAAIVMGILAPLTLVDLARSLRPGAKPAMAVEIWAALAFLFLITTYLATSITARLREKEAELAQSERSLDAAYRGMAALYELGQRVNATRDVDQVLSMIAQHATRLLRGKASFIRLLDPTGKSLYIGGSFGLSQAYMNKGPVEVGKSLVDHEALRGATIQVLEVGDDQRFQYREEARREGLRSMLTCPMRAKGRTLGVIRVYTGEPHVFTEQEENLLMNLANLGAIAIQNVRAYSELRALDKERVWFARTTHHQLRSPLAAVQAAIDALPFAGMLNETQKDLVSRARARIQDAFDTIRDLLDLAAVQRVESVTPAAPVRLKETLKRVLGIAQERCLAKRLAFVVAMDDTAGSIRADVADLERIFSNLLDNAVKYTSHGSVTVRTTSAGGWSETIIEDTGIGIKPEDQERIFDGFYRSVAAKAASEVGTGLGLSIVRKMVTKLGGTIAVESTPGKGSRFIVRLPETAE